MKINKYAWCFTFLVVMTSQSWSADAKNGQVLAGACSVCHGVQGLSMAPNTPNLAAQPSMYLEEQLKNYRSGQRKHEVMAVMAKPLSNSDIENLAAWYSSLKIQIVPND
ncbi:cytochrome c [Limnohabitans sp.]|jgi:cytochrome c553|uniref:c-type cytochrome n=1 Tax=Limnohabitans sp. TaxID=1907725 RepID=UPI00286F8435|nr:cytochrome c [Limnohabitans sp.]